jgi:Type ISP C-terminal specificity domain/N-6 DNA Methylase
VTDVPEWVSACVSIFGVKCAEKLAGPGDKEAAIRSPLDELLGAAGAALNVKAVFHDEVRDSERQVRPDYGVSVCGAITGYIEVKAPGRTINPGHFKGHDLRQWERQRDLPNLLYTNGTEWRLYRDSEPAGEPVTFNGGPLDTAKSGLTAPAEFEAMITDFLRWKPAPITSVGALVRAVAPLTRLLRGEVLDQLDTERRAIKAGQAASSQPFLGLAQDWRALLFPTATDDVFADGYAQTVTFALLLARTENIDLTGVSLHGVGRQLGHDHSLMGKALQLLTDDVAADFKVTLDLLVRVVGAVAWDRIRRGKRDTYLQLYEHFLELYDPELRKKSGSYYTPREVVDQMVRLTEAALTSKLGKTDGFADPTVLTVDPGMGTGTYLHSIIERIADRARATDGPGSVPGAITAIASRLVGFEIQMGPYAVAELRTTDLVRDTGAKLPPDGMRLFVTDTLDDPHAAETQLGSGLKLIAEARHKANEVKANTKVTVVIGNPPYRERAEGMGGWVEGGSPAVGTKPPLDAFRDVANPQHAHNLKNLYVYFWRWATWKVFDANRDGIDGDAGIVCFITTAGYLGGPGFGGMRQYLRKTCDEGWIIDLSPEGQTPDVATRVFPGVRQPLAIGLFLRRPGKSPDLPADIHYMAVHGRRSKKFAALQTITLDGPTWRDARTDWASSFTPAAAGSWDEWPALGALMPWTSPGCTGNRRWPYAPAPSILSARWSTLIAESDDARKSQLFKVTRDRTLDKVPQPLVGTDTCHRDITLDKDVGTAPTPVRLGYRSFDRQWVIPDSRLLDMPRPSLWSARIPGQIFLIEQHSDAISSGPGLVFSALIPDLHHFNNRGGRTLPMLNPDGSGNTTPGLLSTLSTLLGVPVTVEDLVAYIAAVAAHPGFVGRFTDELTTPGIRVPITSDPDLWAEAVDLGRLVVWLHTYGEAFADDGLAGRPVGNVRFTVSGDRSQPKSLTAVTGMPETIAYDADTETVSLGDGQWGPVRREVWAYDVGGKNVLKSWFNYRKAVPGGKKTSPLDYVHVDVWPQDWTIEFIDLLTVLTRLVDLEVHQAKLLDKVLAGPLFASDDLAAEGVRWPTNPSDRKPRYGLPAEQHTMDI